MSARASRSISDIFVELDLLADPIIYRPKLCFGKGDDLKRLSADLAASLFRARDLGISLDCATMLITALTHIIEADRETDDGRWGIIAEHLAGFLKADLKRAGELELHQMRSEAVR